VVAASCSPDGETWVKRPSGTQDSLSGIAYGNGHFVAIGRFPTILESSSVITLAITHATIGFPTLWLEGPAELVYTIQSSPDLISWRNLTNLASAQSTSVILNAPPDPGGRVFYRAYSQ